jgi:hypothetical protein
LTGPARRDAMLRLAAGGRIAEQDVLARAMAGDPDVAGTRLAVLLSATRGWPMGKAAAKARHFLDKACGDKSPAHVTLRWVVDGRSRGRRLSALADTLTPLRDGVTPWPGFPYAAAPRRPRKEP